MVAAQAAKLKQPTALSPRIQWLRDYYFKGAERAWNNEYTSWTTGTPWDVQFQEMTYYIVPEVYPLLATLRASYRQAAHPVPLPADFWRQSLPERRAWFVHEVMVNQLPKEILPGDLIAGARFNIQTSLCLNEREQADYDRLVSAPGGAREKVKAFHDHGYGNAGATSGHLVPGYERALTLGFKGLHAEIEERLLGLSQREQDGPKGAALRAMRTAATLPRDLAARYAQRCNALATEESDGQRRYELTTMARNLARVPWEPPRNFHEALQALWLVHMLVMADENYPGPGVSFGRFDQYLLPYYERSLKEGATREELLEILKCFWIHANTAYDAQIRNGNQGITAGYGQLLTLSGLGPDGRDMTNPLTFLALEALDDVSPILEPKVNVRLHRQSPPELLTRVVDMIADSQGAPFLLNFDERSMAGMLLEGKRLGLKNRIDRNNVHDYAPVGCLENTMVGNDRSGTVDVNLNLVKAIELALGDGSELVPVVDPLTGKKEEIRQAGPKTGKAEAFADFEDFFSAYAAQTRYIVTRIARLYEESEAIRARFFPTPYLSCLVKGCVDSARDITQGGAEINAVTMEAVTFATTVDSLLAIRYLVFEKRLTTMAGLIAALRANWEGHEVLRAQALNKAPKYGRDDREADAMAKRVMALWTAECWQQRTRSTDRPFRPGMLSWNYWAGDGYVVTATPNGRAKGQFLSNAICPSNGADTKGPTANSNSVGHALEGPNPQEEPDWQGAVNLLPNGASHTITFNPSILRDPEHRDKFTAFLKGYAHNGGTALQINMLDPEMLKDAQRHPADYRHLLVRVTGYNAYFTSIGRELQDEVIARLSHGRF